MYVCMYTRIPIQIFKKAVENLCLKILHSKNQMVLKNCIINNCYSVAAKDIGEQQKPKACANTGPGKHIMLNHI